MPQHEQQPDTELKSMKTHTYTDTQTDIHAQTDKQRNIVKGYDK